jgi:D-alanyl-D-alanine carboxypeptidase
VGRARHVRHEGLVLDEQAMYARSDATGWHISSAYRKSHTCWQHHAAFNGGVTYTERARTAPRRIRIRKSRVAGLLVVIAAITALSLEWRASSSSRDSSSSTAAAPIQVPRGERSRSLSETGGAASTGRLGLGEADGAVPDGTTVFDDEIPAVAKLNSDLLGAVRRAATDAADDGVHFYVDSGWRSPEYQARLLREAISKYGSEAEATRWVATPNTSAHVKGDAVDIGPSAAAAWLSEHGAAYGLCQIYANEPWHYELRLAAIARGCPPTYTDPTHDPRMQQ